MTRPLDFADVALRHDPQELRRQRPRSRLVRWTLAVLALICAFAWASGDVAVDDLFSARRAENLERFLAQDLAPHALRGEPWSLRAHLEWAFALGVDRGFDGVLATLAISVLAIVLAGFAALGLSFLAARNVAAAAPFERWSGPQRDRASGARAAHRAWTALATATRAALVLLRAIPEYVWAFLLLAMLGPSAWPAVLALAIHNTGILGKLGAETIENLDPRPLAAVRGLGGSRAQVVAAAAVPLALGRFLLYFFYRFETCVREATVLGMLGVVSLGYWIQDARAKQFYDEMAVFVAFGALLVLAADLASALLRALLRRVA